MGRPNEGKESEAAIDLMARKEEQRARSSLSLPLSPFSVLSNLQIDGVRGRVDRYTIFRREQEVMKWMTLTQLDLRHPLED